MNLYSKIVYTLTKNSGPRIYRLYNFFDLLPYPLSYCLQPESIFRYGDSSFYSKYQDYAAFKVLKTHLDSNGWRVN
jgi:hypothetical protein